MAVIALHLEFSPLQCLRWKKATGWNEDGKLESIFKKYAVTYVKEPVVIDDNVVTAEGPNAAKVSPKES